MTISTQAPPDLDLTRTARTTGLFYLGLGITGMLGFLLVRSQLYVAGDADATLANLTEHVSLTRFGVALEAGVVITQALAALWFYRLFRGVDAFAAGAVAVFGLLNAVAIMGSAALLGTAATVAGDTSAAVGGDAAGTVQLAYVVSEQFWAMGTPFFGLWLIPMGWLVLRSGWLPRPLGWTLIVGGVGYLLSAFLDYLFADPGVVLDLLVLPATIGELWIIGYLVVFGVRRTAAAAAARS